MRETEIFLSIFSKMKPEWHDFILA